MKCVIFSGADIANYDFVASKIARGDLIICADSGIRHAEKLNLITDVWVGDFDSYSDSENVHYKERITLPREKDDTDTLSAAKIAVKRGATEVILLGCIGSRLDHTLANLFVLNFLYTQGVNATLIDENNEIKMLTDGKIQIPKSSGAFLSVLPFGCIAIGVTLCGVKYSLNDATLDSIFPIGISNEIIDNFAIVTVKSGTLAIFLSHD